MGKGCPYLPYATIKYQRKVSILMLKQTQRSLSALNTTLKFDASDYITAFLINMPRYISIKAKGPNRYIHRYLKKRMLIETQRCHFKAQFISTIYIFV
jgi:hypothetical protein